MKVSIVIPALNEEGCIEETVRSLRHERPHEILVVDGGSTDATCQRAAAADAVLAGPRGRAAQLNHGAAHASGDALLFLHADCTLEAGALASVRNALRRPGVIAGCFRMCVKARGASYRLIDFCATARVWLTGIVYGDQGLFLRREAFAGAGGFPPLRLMEDLFLSLELRKHGRIVVVPSRVFVSPRRWQRQGIVRQTLRNWALTALAASGVHPDRLAAYYPAVR
ncbi:MAG: TIGR04283 family arsenosugar biosynthesis glycosyltransferase [Planctomycetes bacterium]|nr:TIGR04283 family arsenosugar biosynthesis glycosyltransferase [Planctomycetota bacterium]